MQKGARAIALTIIMPIIENDSPGSLLKIIREFLKKTIDKEVIMTIRLWNKEKKK
ncbi:MAG: hypothetical protein P9L96_00755 [Candidatus Gygaella obscura]|nr:hypothetical protein [Candidatus Gygaella obscura]